jgi:hypothetical protein
MMTTSGFSFSSSSRKSLYAFGWSPLRSLTRSAATSSVFASASHNAMTFTRSLVIASLRMFLPHHPEPMSAVRYLRPGSAPNKGTALKATVTAALVFRKWRRVNFMIGLLKDSRTSLAEEIIFLHPPQQHRHGCCGNR